MKNVGKLVLALFSGCFRDCLLPVLSFPVWRGARLLFPLPVPGGQQELLVTGGVTWHWGELLGEESALIKIFRNGLDKHPSETI